MVHQKVNYLLLLLSLCWASLEVSAKVQTVNINVKNASLTQFFGVIESQTTYRFSYRNGAIDKKRDITMRCHDAEVPSVLNAVLPRKNLSYDILSSKTIAIKEKNVHNTSNVSQQNETVNGVVTDVNGDPIVGASVIQKGTKNGTITDIDGRFSFSAPVGCTLVISYIGFQDVEVISGRNLKIQLREDQKALEEVVVIGYGTVKKSDLTGSVSSVKGDELTRMATGSPVAALQGRAAGVTVNLSSGSPDASASIQVRGVGTPNDSSPLYVVDGFPMADIDYLSPNDIKSIEILKDASACAIYGSRGANGVVVITTKSGQSGDLKTLFTAYCGIEHMASKPTMLTSSQYAELSNEAYTNADKDPVYVNTSSLDYDTNWYDAISHTGTFQQYNLNLSGGSEKVQSAFSAGYYKRDGLVKSTKFDKITLSENNVFKPTKWLAFRSSMTVSMLHFKRLDATSLFLSSLIAPPDLPVWDNETNYYTGIKRMRLENPAGRIARNNGRNKRFFFVGNFSADINLAKDLVFTSRFGVKTRNRNDVDFTPVYYETSDNSTLLNVVYRNTQRAIDWTWENMLNFHHNWKGVHDLTVMGATSARSYKNDYYSVSKQSVPIETDNFWYFDSATENPMASGYGAELTMLSYLGRINYSLFDRYLLTVSIRADGSSRFAKNNRWGYFPSTSLAWKYTEEPFIKRLNLKWLNSGKIRFGYGEIGNENISSYYPYLTPISQQYYYTLGISQTRINGATPSGIGNEDAKWETSKQGNIGIDLGLFNNQLILSADFYVRKTSDILLSQQIPNLSGFSSMVRNVGGMKNTGLEFSATYKGHISDFKYDVNGNFAVVRNRVTSLGSSDALIRSIPYDNILIDLQGSLGNIIRSEVGRPYGQFYGYKTAGIFQNQNEIIAYKGADGKPIQPDALPGDTKYIDVNRDGVIDTKDMTFIGNPIPDVTFGLSVNASWKNYDFNVLFTGVAGNDIFNAAKYYFMRFDGKQNVRTEYLKEYWHGEGTSNKQPIVTQDLTRNTRNFRGSDYYVENGSFVRLKTLQLGYTFTPRLAQNFKPSIRVYFSAQNLFTITGYSGFDPEINSDISVDRGQYPQPQSFMLGTNINF